ncbi:ABC transporter permease [Entomohabitans teleogrylli]|uniref:ABC transporter permease n=1 Tax=Entomohabitans teleogrylli TaxID=1384589 RepID=UPI00073D3937|nr:ABC transporter permease [Entomohabitans teleogrylli]
MFAAIHRYRGFIIDSVKRDFQSRYQTSFLGAAWLVLQPVAMIAVYTLIFSELMRAKLAGMDGPFAYSIYLCSGVLTWGLFTETLNSLVNVFLSNANILKKLSFPRICLPIIVSASAFINFLIIFSLFVLFLVVTGNFPGWVFFEMIPVLLVQMVFTIGLGIILGVMNVFVRDVGQFVSILLQFWFWFTPIVYVSKTLPEWAVDLLRFNPMATIIGAYQNIMLYRTSPDWAALAPIAAISVVLFFLAWRLFRKHSADIVDEI